MAIVRHSSTRPVVLRVWAYCGDGTVNPLAGEQCDDRAGGDDTGYGLADCTINPEFIPTVSEWGLIVMTLLLLVGLKVKFGRRAVA